MKNRVAMIIVLSSVLPFLGCQEIMRAVEAINRMVQLNVGPATEKWPTQPTDDATKAILETGKQTAERRSSLKIVATGSLVDSYVGGRSGRAILRWKRPEMLRIDFEGEAVEAGGRPVKRTFLRPSIHEWRQYDEIEKSLKIVDWRNADKAAKELSIFRLDPLSWFFRDKTDVARRRFRLERIDATEQGIAFDLKPANDEWQHRGEIVLNPNSGMPTRIVMKSLPDTANGAKQELVVESLEENPGFDEDVFKPWTPKEGGGWTIVHQSMGVKEDAEAVLNMAPDRAVVMAPQKGIR